MKIKIAKLTDCEFVFRVRLSVRDWCRNTEVLAYEKHKEFFEKHLDTYKIIELDKQDVGYIRYEEGGFIAIHLLDNFRGKGLGTKVLETLKGRAIVLYHNQRSLQAFVKAGWNIRGFYLEK